MLVSLTMRKEEPLIWRDGGIFAFNAMLLRRILMLRNKRLGVPQVGQNLAES